MHLQLQHWSWQPLFILMWTMMVIEALWREYLPIMEGSFTLSILFKFCCVALKDFCWITLLSSLLLERLNLRHGVKKELMYLLNYCIIYLKKINNLIKRRPSVNSYCSLATRFNFTRRTIINRRTSGAHIPALFTHRISFFFFKFTSPCASGSY